MRKFKVHHQWCQDKCWTILYFDVFLYKNSEFDIFCMFSYLQIISWLLNQYKWIRRQALKLEAWQEDWSCENIKQYIRKKINHSPGISLIFSVCNEYFVWKGSLRSHMKMDSIITQQAIYV